jgi:Cyclic nucleotide-binding domain
MDTVRQFKIGDILFRQGDASDRVFLLRSGEFEVWREIGTNSVLLGHVRQGEWLGEMGVIEGRKRSATAVAGASGSEERPTTGWLGSCRESTGGRAALSAFRREIATSIARTSETRHDASG